MQLILVHANQDAGFEDRLKTGIHCARNQRAHLRLLITSPIQQFATFDPFGGTFFAAEALSQAEESDNQLEIALRRSMEGQDVSWDIQRASGNLLTALASSATIADLAILSLADDSTAAGPLTLAGDLAIEAPTPILGLPRRADALRLFERKGPALLAWNGSLPCAKAMCAMVRWLEPSEKILLLTVGQAVQDYAAEDAEKYLKIHGFEVEIRHREAEGGSIEAVIEAQAESINAALIVMGAYGSSRLRETLFGGTTRYFLEESLWPLLLSH